MTRSRPRVPRPSGEPFAFACVPCGLVLDDGVDYVWCPRCNGGVDWIDPRTNVWACRTCDELVTGGRTAPPCHACDVPMARLVAQRPAAPTPPLTLRSITQGVFVIVLVIQAALALVMPGAFPYLATWLVIAQIVGVGVVGTTLLVAPDIRALARDQRTRILHGLEHATINLLEERGFAVRSGYTYDGEFVIRFVHDGRSWERLDEIRAACADAIRRVVAGEHALAYSPLCGTSYLVGRCLLALAIVGMGITALVLGMPPGITFALSVAACFGAHAIRRRAGLFAQRWLTVSTDVASAAIRAVDRSVTSTGDAMHVTFAVDVTPRARDGGAVPLP